MKKLALIALAFLGLNVLTTVSAAYNLTIEVVGFRSLKLEGRFLSLDLKFSILNPTAKPFMLSMLQGVATYKGASLGAYQSSHRIQIPQNGTSILWLPVQIDVVSILNQVAQIVTLKDWGNISFSGWIMLNGIKYPYTYTYA